MPTTTFILKPQQALVVVYRKGEKGEWVTTMCRRGAERMIGQKIRGVTEVEVTAKVKQ